jgi:hypothetical protein
MNNNAVTEIPMAATIVHPAAYPTTGYMVTDQNIGPVPEQSMDQYKGHCNGKLHMT